MPLLIRPIAPEEFEDFVRCDRIAFGSPSRQESIEHERALFEFDRSLAAFDGGRIVAEIGGFSFWMRVPGGELPTTGTTWVSVLPTHRRRGLLTELMRRHLDDARDRGEPVAALWASEAGIYGRFGFGSAAPVIDVEVTRAGALAPVHAADPAAVQLVDRDLAVTPCAAVYEKVQAQRAGCMRRSASWWQHAILVDLEHERGDRSEKLVAIHDSGDGPDGYVVYRLREVWEGWVPQGTVEISELVTATPAATGALWRYCIQTDLMTRAVAPLRPVDDPLPFLLAEPRRARCQIRDGLWVRLVDLPSALSRRGYAAAGELVLQVIDPFCPWNDGRWRLEADEEGATCERTDRAPDLTLPTDALAAAYLGGIPLTQLAAAGLVEGSPEAITRLDRLLRVPLMPWQISDF
ncbi:MAG: GNAT family N-acetyltransferase [Egibacteraceae bacterium]